MFHLYSVGGTLCLTCHSPGGAVCCRFGDLSVQETVNIDSYKRLYAYYEKFVEIIGEPGMIFLEQNF